MPLLPSFLLRSTLLLLLAALVWPAVARAQSPEGGLHCGDRQPGSYAVVLDVSTSLRRDGRSDLTEERYVDVLSLITGVLCRGEVVRLYTFVPDAKTRTESFATLISGERARERLREVVRRSFENDPQHTDLHLALRRIRDDLLTVPDSRAVFLLTDGSFYPHAPGLREHRLRLVRDRMTAFAELADTLARERRPLFVIGIGANSAEAVDPDLRPVWPGRASDRRWHRPGSGIEIDLNAASGDTLLRLVFGPRYTPVDSFSAWRPLVGGPDAVWTHGLGYTTGWDAPLTRLRSVAMQHLVFLPPPGGDSICAAVRANPSSRMPAGQSALVGPGGRVLCSLQQPTAEEVLRVAALGVGAAGDSMEFAFRQTPVYSASPAARLHGLHDLVLPRRGATCQKNLLGIYFSSGRSWPLPHPDVPRQRLRIERQGFSSPANTGPPSAAAHDVVTMVEPSPGCLVPNFPLNGWERRAGDYLLFFGHEDGEWVEPRSIAAPRLAVLSVTYRPGGFPFPPDRLALLRLCVVDTSAVSNREPVHVELGDTVVHLSPAAAGSSCARRAGPGVVHSFRGVVLFPKTATLSIGRVVISPQPPMTGGDWIPLSLEADGRLFLPVWAIIALFVAGVFVQSIYIKFGWKDPGETAKERRTVELDHAWHTRRLLSAGLSLVLSGTILVVIAQCLVMGLETDLRNLSLPVPFMVLVIVHGLKLLAAGFVPEIVEDTLL